MALDEQLISRSQQEDEETESFSDDASDFDYELEESVDRAGILRSEIQKAKNGLAPTSSGDLRADRMAARRQQVSLKNKATREALAPMRIALAKLLQSAWTNLIPSWGLTLLYIDLHVFFSLVFGKDLFCDLGEEWTMGKSGMSIGKK